METEKAEKGAHLPHEALLDSSGKDLESCFAQSMEKFLGTIHDSIIQHCNHKLPTKTTVTRDQTLGNYS